MGLNNNNKNINEIYGTKKNTCTNADADVNKKAHLIWSMCLNSNELHDSPEDRNQNRFVNEMNKMLIHIYECTGGEGWFYCYWWR